MIDVNGIAHVNLTVARFEECKAFYKALLPFLGLKLVFDGESMCYHVGSRTGIAIQKCAPEYTSDRFNQERPGLHHLCFRARSLEDVDTVFHFLQTLKAHIISRPQEGPWAPGYYYLLFEDPDGIRIEINHVPGKGVFAEKAGFSAGGDYH